MHRSGVKKGKPREAARTHVTSGIQVMSKVSQPMTVLARAKVKPLNYKLDMEEHHTGTNTGGSGLLMQSLNTNSNQLSGMQSTDQPAPNPPVAQVAPIPRVGCLPPPPDIQYETVPHGAPIVDVNGTPMIDAATGQPLIAAPVAPQAQVFQAPVHITGADGGLYQVQPATPIQIIGGGQGLQVAPGGGTALQITPQGAIAVAPHVGAMQAINIAPGPLQQIHIMQNTMVPSPTIRHGLQQNYDNASPNRRKNKHDISPEIASKSLSALKDRKDEIIMELGNIVGTQAAHTISEMAQQHATANHKLRVDLDPPDMAAANRRGSGQDGMQGTYGMWTTKPLVTINNLREGISRNVNSCQRHPEDDELKPLPDGICVSRFGPISRKPIFTKTACAEPCAVVAHLGPSTNPTPSLNHPLPATSPVPGGVQMFEPDVIYNMETQPNPSDYMIVEGMDSIAMNHLVNPPCMPQSPMPNPRDQLTNLSSQNLNLYAQSARMKKELIDLQVKISSLNIVAENSSLALDRDRLAMELRMIEQGIRERHHEISENQIHPASNRLGSDYVRQGMGKNEEEQQSNMRGYEDQFNKPSQGNVTEYNYW
jgi:hypothetical protein